MYHLFRDKKMATDGGETPNADQQKRIWRDIWRLKVPNKVKIIAWRACMDGLPTRYNLKKRKVIEEANCQFRFGAEEDTKDALYQCSTLKESWTKHLNVSYSTEPNQVFVDIARQVSERGNKEELEKAFFLLLGAAGLEEIKWLLKANSWKQKLLLIKPYLCRNLGRLLREMICVV